MPPKQTKRVTGTVGEGAAGKKAFCYQLSIRMLIDKPFSRVLVTIQLLISQPSYQPTIDNESQIINS